MVKKRNSNDVEGFIEAAENASRTMREGKAPDPKAKRDFKAIKFPMNEFEYELFTQAAEKTGRSLSGFLRYAAKKEAESEADKN